MKFSARASFILAAALCAAFLAGCTPAAAPDAGDGAGTADGPTAEELSQRRTYYSYFKGTWKSDVVGSHFLSCFGGNGGRDYSIRFTDSSVSKVDEGGAETKLLDIGDDFYANATFNLDEYNHLKIEYKLFYFAIWPNSRTHITFGEYKDGVLKDDPLDPVSGTSAGLPSGFDITSGIYGYSSGSSNGGTLKFDAGGTFTFTANNASLNSTWRSGTYALDGDTLTLSMTSLKSASTSFTDKFTASYSGGSLTLSLSSDSSTTAGTDTSGTSSAFIMSLFVSYKDGGSDVFDRIVLTHAD